METIPEEVFPSLSGPVMARILESPPPFEIIDESIAFGSFSTSSTLAFLFFISSLITDE